MHYVYVLKSKSRSYIGYTGDIKKRFKEHNCGLVASTKVYRPWKLVHCEPFSSRSLALKREKFLKTGDGRRVLELKGII